MNFNNWIYKFLFSSSFSATSGGILDRAIEAEDKKHGDFLRLVSFIILPFLYPFVPHVHSLKFKFHFSLVITSGFFFFFFLGRTMLKGTLNCPAKLRYILRVLLLCGMLNFMSRLMMTFM